MRHSDWPLHSANLHFVEALYARYLAGDDTVPEDWRHYFGGIREESNPIVQERLDQLVRNYRVRGHMAAQLDPLGVPRPSPPELAPAFYGFGPDDMERTFLCDGVCGGGVLTLREILDRLRETYCRSIGAQFMHIDDGIVRQWLQDRMESSQNRLQLSRSEQLRILRRLTDAVIFEEFVRRRFIGAKSFSLEGAESLIPLLDLAIERAGEHGVDEIVFGMAHRGRLNVLANVMGKSPGAIFREFADVDSEHWIGRGDVKYHLGYSGEWTTLSGRNIHLSLCFNPSHLEVVNPVVLGRVRAKQDRAGDHERTRALAVLIHGDAAFAGQGIVQETLNLSQLESYRVGGALHIIVNNQIGFTTSPSQTKSTVYATDVARMLQSPIVHVNGEDPEAVAQAVRLAMDFRREFRRDVVIDMYCYRRLGHNEGDEPSFTQPLLYQAVQRRKPVREGYLEHLLRLQEVTKEEAEAIVVERQGELEAQLSASTTELHKAVAEAPRGVWAGYSGGAESVAEPDTGLPKLRVAALLEALCRYPETFHPHPRIARGLQQRRQMASGERPVDWSAGEALALASLAVEGVRIRLSGQDTERGTFSQRHAVLHDHENGAAYVPLQHAAEEQAPVEIINSPLSEAGVLGFEYGYSLDCPDGLVIWEAQFGDFWNMAQMIVDQFIAAAEDKWRRLSGITLLLPHGFEGSGPEHSSARLERFLELAAEDNIQIVQPTSPAQLFHCLRRQVLRPWRKPLIVMTPKSLLRHPRVTSRLEEFESGGFRRILADTREAARETRLILFCSGKIYFDLEKERESRQQWDVAILRAEQLYPLPESTIADAFGLYPEATPVRWVQEEPANMGAWPHWRFRFANLLCGRFPLEGVTRPASASPATGSHSSHKKEQEELIAKAFSQEGV